MSAVNLAAVDARQIDNEFTRTTGAQSTLVGSGDGASSSDLDIGWRGTDRRCVAINKMKGQNKFIYWALSGCFVNNGVTS